MAHGFLLLVCCLVTLHTAASCVLAEIAYACRGLKMCHFRARMRQHLNNNYAKRSKARRERRIQPRTMNRDDDSEL